MEAEYAEDELNRLKKLHAQKLASQSQLDGAARAARVAKANLVESRSALDQAKRDLARTDLRAPFDGMVRNEKVDLGQFVSRWLAFEFLLQGRESLIDLVERSHLVQRKSHNS